MKVLVTGASGFTGAQMTRYMSAQKRVTLTGLSREEVSHKTNVRKISWVNCDLLDRDRLFSIISQARPDAIVHLAGLNRGSIKELLETNTIGTKNLLDATFKINKKCRILVVSSSAIYGYAGRTTIVENTPFHPLSDYGVSKTAQDSLALMYHALYDMGVAVVRPFNLFGPNQPDSFICGHIVKQVKDIEYGRRKNIDLLETKSYRDFIDVRDAVEAYWAILSHPKFEKQCAGKAFNVGSGIARCVSELITEIESITGKKYKINLPKKPPEIRIPYQECNCSRIHKTTGWAPKISFKKTLADMLDVA